MWKKIRNSKKTKNYECVLSLECFSLIAQDMFLHSTNDLTLAEISHIAEYYIIYLSY